MDRHSGIRKPARRAVSQDRDGLWDWNLVSNRIHFSSGWVAQAGCQEHEIGSTPDDWLRRVHPEDGRTLQRELAAARADGRGEFDLHYRLRHKDGTYHWMVSRALVVRNERGEPIRLTGTQSDVTAETVTDPLTGLPNRLLLLDRLTQSIDRARRHAPWGYAVILLELGRPPGPQLASRTGDPLLNAAARRLESVLRTPELQALAREHDLVARVDGDRFAVLLDGLANLGHARDVSERLLMEMLRPIVLARRDIRLSPAIGIALSATGYDDAGEALRDAETALHRARVLGGSHCELFDPEALTSQQSDLQLQDDLDAALHRREFALAYQPIVSIVSHRLVGFEALLRWRHPRVGPVPPSDFIPIAEATGFIVPLGAWILRQACMQLAAWHATLPEAKHVWISVNVSGVQLGHPDLPSHVDAALCDAGLPPHSLVLELTEGIAMENPSAATTTLMRLRARGVRISIDDFGTGYSSLAYLRQLPVDALKIDQSFVRALETDKDTVAIVTSMVGIAQQLGLHVVAEGIENHRQLALLRSLGCESAQGYLFSPPLDADAAAEFLKHPPVREPNVTVSNAAAPGRADRIRLWLRQTVSSRPALVTGAVVLTVVVFAGWSGLLRTSSDVEIPSPASSGAGVQTAAGTILPRPGASAGESRGAADRLASTPAAPPARSAADARRAFFVLHLHRFGSCRGQLLVSSGGLAYVPDEKGSGDAVTLKPGDFESLVEGETLTVRGRERTYRFRVAPGSAKAHTAAAMGRIVNSLLRRPAE